MDEAERTTDTAPPAFRDVDADADVAALVAMMDATDAWPAVEAARAWVLDQVAVDGALVIDVGCGPGTFNRLALARGAFPIDLDRSGAMLIELRRRRPDAVAAQADLTHLPLRDGAAGVTHVERVLQWTADPVAALGELRRVTTGDGWLAVTDTDWATFQVDHPDPAARARLNAAARSWVPHPTFAGTLGHQLRAAGPATVAERRDVVTIDAWDPDDPGQRDGPPGLPLRTMAQAAAPDDVAATRSDVDALAEAARRGRFHATLELVTVVGRC